MSSLNKTGQKGQNSITAFFPRGDKRKSNVGSGGSATKKQYTSTDSLERSDSTSKFSIDMDYDSHENELENSDDTIYSDRAKVESQKITARTGSLSKMRKRHTRSLAYAEPEDYLLGYPKLKDDSSLNANKMFYFNQIESKPNGDFIDKILEKWYKDYDLLESHHGYIQWLFPIREEGMNFQAQPLQLHEAKAIQENSDAKKRVLESYKMMLDFYGICLTNSDTGSVARTDSYLPRFKHLNRSFHNYLRITRILKSLGELGFEFLKAPLVKFLLEESVMRNTLPNIEKSCCNYFVHTLRSDVERRELITWIKKHSEYRKSIN